MNEKGNGMDANKKGTGMENATGMERGSNLGSGSAPRPEPIDLLHVLRYTRTCRIERTEPRGIRLYQTARRPVHAADEWALQIRTPVSLANGKGDGKESIAAIAILGLGDMIALRDAINAQLEAAGSFYR